MVAGFKAASIALVASAVPTVCKHYLLVGFSDYGAIENPVPKEIYFQLKLFTGHAAFFAHEFDKEILASIQLSTLLLSF